MAGTNVTAWSYILSVSTNSLLAGEAANENRPNINPDPVSPETVDMVTDIISCYLRPVIGACGIVGNLLNIMVFLMQKRSQPMNSLLVMLAVVDACFLLFSNKGVVPCFLSQYDVIAARNLSIHMLPHVLWIAVTLSRMSSLLTVAISVERCLVVLFPLKVKLLVTPFAVHLITALACVIPALAHVPVFLRGEIQWLPHSRLNITLPYLKLTDFAQTNVQFLNLYKNLVLNILFRYVTMGLVLVCTGLTIAQLKRYSRWRLSSVTGESERAIMSERDARVTVTMIRVCVLFLVCSLPGCVMLTIRLIQPQFDYYGVYTYSFQLTAELNEVSLVINSSANVIIYMRGPDEFRRTFYRLCRWTLPTCCFNFLFRCVMRSEPEPSKLENQDSRNYDDGEKKKGRRSRGRGGTATFLSTTNVSSVFSVTSAHNDNNGTVAAADEKATEK